MDQHAFTRYLNGFIIGIVFGVLVVFCGITFYNVYCGWAGCAPAAYTWWYLFPLPLLMGIGMALFVANYTFRD